MGGELQRRTRHQAGGLRSSCTVRWLCCRGLVCCWKQGAEQCWGDKWENSIKVGHSTKQVWTRVGRGSLGAENLHHCFFPRVSLAHDPLLHSTARARRGACPQRGSATTGGGVFNTPHMNILSCAPPPGRDVERVDSGGALQPVVGREPHGRRLCAEVWQQHHGWVGWLLGAAVLVAHASAVQSCAATHFLPPRV